MHTSNKEKYIALRYGNIIHGGEYGIIIHGGASDYPIDPIIQSILDNLVDEAYTQLESNELALDVAEYIITKLEDSGQFNAGKGSVLNAHNQVEMDAAIMDGGTSMAGSVAGVHKIKNPIKAALKVLHSEEYVLLHGKGAEKFAHNLEIVNSSYFINQQNIYGTVGCAVLDRQGNLVSATSTGGSGKKEFNRIGDSPIIGAGLYADSKCAISCTGEGEYFIRTVAAHDVSSLIRYSILDPKSACETVLSKVLKMGGKGGIIGIDSKGNTFSCYNSVGMYMASKSSVKNKSRL